MNRLSFAIAVSLIGALSLTGGTAAGASDAHGAHGFRVPIVYRYVGVDRGVPYRILYAVALAESGYSERAKDIAYGPWPWTLNVQGRPARFDTQAQAVAALRRVIASGTRNVDIGPGQINYHFNGSLLPSLEEAFDPEVNLRAASTVLLRELAHCESVLRQSDWWCAVGRYHSPGRSAAQTARRERYIARVQRLYEDLPR